MISVNGYYDGNSIRTTEPLKAIKNQRLIITLLDEAISEDIVPVRERQPRYNAETEAAMQEARDIMDGKIQTKSYRSARELFDELDAEAEDA